MTHAHGASRPDPGEADDTARSLRERDLLLEVTQIPSASGREDRVVEFLRAFVAARPELHLRADRAGNLIIEPLTPWGRPSHVPAASARTPRMHGQAQRTAPAPPPSRSPIFITAHLDHPAFVVERIVGPGTVEVSFRGGVNDDYFIDARIVIHPQDHSPIGATLTGVSASPAGSCPFGTLYLAELDGAEPASNASDSASLPAELDAPGAAHLRVGDVATWALPPAEVDAQGIVHTLACDDLAALAAALCAYDRLLALVRRGEPVQDVRLLFTRAEEIGFIGAIAACRLGTIPRGARLIALENSRASAEAPVGGGPIVRVGDRLSVFDPRLTAACAKRAEQITANPAAPTATQRTADLAGKPRWQRKLMAGGACEATVFCAYSFQATCLCVPLGNYHNMGELDRVQAGMWDKAALGPPRVAREYIALSDYQGLIDLLTAIGQELQSADPIMPRLDKLFDAKSGVLGDLAAIKRSAGTKRARAKPPRAGARGGGAGKPPSRAASGKSSRKASRTKPAPRPRNPKPRGPASKRPRPRKR